MCKSCKSIKDYQNIDSSATLNQIKGDADSLVSEGTFSVLYDYNHPEADYREIQFLCEDCGKVHVLWLHTFLCRTGGEWRSAPSSLCH